MSESTSTGDFPEVPYYKLDDYQALRASYDALAARLAGELEHERDACSQLARGAVIRAEAAEARVRELEHALRRASERLSWFRDHHCSSEFARGQAKMAADECWRVQAGERATASAGGGQ